MCDLEVIITNLEYRTLKQYEQEAKALRETNRSIQQELWYSQQEIKEKNQLIETAQKNIKELSRNAICMSKKIFAFDDLLAKQEEKWLKRQKQLLEKLMHVLTAKEQLEEACKRERQTSSHKEQLIRQAQRRINQLEQQNIAYSTNSKKQKDVFSQLSAQLTQLQQQLDTEQINSGWKSRNYDRHMVDCKHRQEIQQKSIEQKNVLLRQKEKVINAKNAVIEKLQRQSKERYERELDEKQAIIKSFQKQLKGLESIHQSLEHQNEILQTKILSLKETLRPISSSLSYLKAQVMRLKNFVRDEINDIKQIFSTQISQVSFQLQAADEQHRSIHGLTLENSILRKELRHLEDQLSQNKNRLQAQIEQLLKQNRQAQAREEQERTNKTQLNKSLSQTKFQLNIERQQKIQYQSQIASLKQEISVCRKKIRDLEDHLYRPQQMNTQTIQLHQQAIYGQKKQMRKGSPNFKEVIDNFWFSIDEYLASKHTYLTGLEELKEEAGLIIHQEFKLIIKRFQHKFDEKYNSNVLRK